MEFLRKLPVTANPLPDEDYHSFFDARGNQRNAYRVTIPQSGSETVTCNISGERLERAIVDGQLDKSRVLLFFPEARSLMVRHTDAQKLSFTARVKHAHYQLTQATGVIKVRYDAEVWDGKSKYKSFSGENAHEVMAAALQWMEAHNGTSIQMNRKTKPEIERITVIKDSYEGKKNLSHVEIELHLEFLTEVEGWILLPVGV